MFLSDRASKEKGFTLIELLITIAIIGIVTGMMLARYGSFNSVVLLKNQAYEVALDLREAQTYALSVRNPVIAQTVSYEEYGIYFNLNAPQTYVFFQDDDGISPAVPYYDSAELLALRYLDSRFRIVQLCVGSNCSITNLTISFGRPNFDAEIRSGSAVYNDARITIASVTDPTYTRSISVSVTGQITVQ